nr:hypothetical protein [uncultured Roseibium sp.]
MPGDTGSTNPNLRCGWRAGAALTAERGATVTQMMAIFGWTSEDMATLYTRKANRKKIDLEYWSLLDLK